MTRGLEEIARCDRRWLQAHPERCHRCRWPDPGELDFCGTDLGTHLIISIRHLGRGCLVYQLVIFHGALPASEESTAALFYARSDVSRAAAPGSGASWHRKQGRPPCPAEIACAA
jgi:hypothetical protein